MTCVVVSEAGSHQCGEKRFTPVSPEECKYLFTIDSWESSPKTELTGQSNVWPQYTGCDRARGVLLLSSGQCEAGSSWPSSYKVVLLPIRGPAGKSD